MTTKAEFNAEEWSKVAAGPLVAGLTLIAADRGGSVRESMALAKTITEEQQNADNPELIRELLKERPDPGSLARETEGGTAGDVQVRAHEFLREAIGLLEAKAAPDEVDAYKRLCLEGAQRVAERTKSGGVLGVGGERVSQDEQRALEELRATLGI